MASTNKTATYSLNLWEPEDHVLREDFNEDNSRIDTALFGLGRVCGTYTGTGTSTTQPIALGFRPSAVLVHSKYPAGDGRVSGVAELALDGVPSDGVAITADGFQASLYANNNIEKVTPYRYIAWR